jgi:hypothetical protein
MNKHLEDDLSKSTALLEKTLEIAAGYLDSIQTLPPAREFTHKEMLGLPVEGLASERTLELFMQRYGRDLPASNGPRFWGLVTGGTTPAALIGDWLVSTYDLNLSHAANSGAPDIEMEAIAMLRELFGLPAAFSGVFVTGATLSNFAGLAMAREWLGRHYNKNVSQDGLQSIPPIKVISAEAHASGFHLYWIFATAPKNHAQGVMLDHGCQPTVESNDQAIIQANNQPANQAHKQRARSPIK